MITEGMVGPLHRMIEAWGRQNDWDTSTLHGVEMARLNTIEFLAASTEYERERALWAGPVVRAFIERAQ